MILEEIGCLSYRTLSFSSDTNDGELRANLDLVEEVRFDAVVKNEVLRNRVPQYHNARVNNIHFKVGDMVLRILGATRNIGGT